MDEDFARRRAAARERLVSLPGNYAKDSSGRNVFFDAVYETAEGDEAAVPWADLEPKGHLLTYLEANPGVGRTAIDVACGLGDNAEAIAQTGYRTTAFDVVDDAIQWARRRFPNTKVDYQTADLFALPAAWNNGFDLVHDCYTLQALPEEIIVQTAEAICGLVALGGKLLIYTRWRENGADVDGPPWPLEERNLDLPVRFGLTKVSEERFETKPPKRTAAHSFAIWEKPSRA